MIQQLKRLISSIKSWVKNMVLKFNGNTIENVKYNGTEINKLQFNGTTVWERQSTPTGTILLEKDVAGTYTVTVPEAGKYTIQVVGAGGGSAMLGWSMATGQIGYHLSQVASGGSGGYFTVTKSLTKGDTLTVVVGALGTNAPQWSKVNGTFTLNGTAGGNTTVTSKKSGSLATANGGGGASIVTIISGNGVSINRKTFTGGTAGTGATKNGTAGTTKYQQELGSDTTATLVATASSYLTYGKGSGGYAYANSKACGYNQNQQGTAGYVKIVKA